MGAFAITPLTDIPRAPAVMDSMSKACDVAILQQPAPWPELLAGASIDSLVQDRGNVASRLRARGLDVIFLVDPLDGLDRRREDSGLVAAGRSIHEPFVSFQVDRANAELGDPSFDHFALIDDFDIDAHMGLLDTNLRRKPSYAEWERIFERPLDR